MTASDKDVGAKGKKSGGNVLHWLGDWFTNLRANFVRSEPISAAKVIGIIVGPSAFILITAADLSMTSSQQNLLAVLVLTITFWITQVMPIPLTAIMAMALAVVSKVAPASDVFGAFSSPTLFLLLGSFIITESMIKYGLGRRVAFSILSIPGIARSTYGIILSFGALAALLSTVLDNGAVAAILLPIAVALSKTFQDELEDYGGLEPGKKYNNFTIALLLIIAYGSTVGALLTPLGDASNIVGWEFIKNASAQPVSIGGWMTIAAPIVCVLFIVLCITVLAMNRPEIGVIPKGREQVREELSELGPMSRGEINTIIVFVLAVTFWLAPSAVAAIYGHESDLYTFLSTRLPPSVVAILAAGLLFVMPVSWKRGPTLKWRDVTDTNWGPVFLVGATLALGVLLGKTGLAHEIGSTMANRVDGLSEWAVYGFAGGAAIMFSELTTNLVSVTVLVPLIPALATSGGGDPMTAALIATFAAIYGFMLPISTAANAVIYGSGKVPLSRMIKTGFLVDISGVLLVMVGVYLMINWVGLF